MSAISIGGTYVNNINTIYGNVSLDVSGHTFLRGNLYVGGATNITGNGGFTGNDLTLSGNLTLGGNINSTGTDLYINGNTIIFDASNGLNFLTGNADMTFQPYGVGSLYFQPQGSGDLVFGTTSGSATMDAYNEATFVARNGTLTFQTDTSNIVFFGSGANSEIILETDTKDITLNPAGSGASGNVNLNGKLYLQDGIYSTNGASILNINSPNVDFQGDSGGFIQTMRQTDATKTFTFGMDGTEAFIGTAGNLDLSIDASRYLKIARPLYPIYSISDISLSAMIGYQDASSNTNNLPKATTRSMITLTNLPAGVWLLEGRGGWSHTDAGNRFLCWFTTVDTLDRTRAVYLNQNTTSYQQMECVTVVRNTTATTWYLTARAGTSTGTLANEEFYARWTRLA
jgi:hypothetical protein